MAIIDWPSAFGYAEFEEQPYRSRGPYVHRSVYTGAVHVSYGGGRRRHGSVTTPVSTATGVVQPEITALIAQVSDPANQLRLPRPLVRGRGISFDPMVVHVTRIRPPERDERGVWRGWQLEFIEIGAAADVLPPPERAPSCPALSGTVTAKSDDSGFDVSIPVTQTLVDEVERTAPADSNLTQLSWQLYMGTTAPAVMSSLDGATTITLSGLSVGTPITFTVTAAVMDDVYYSLQAQWVRADGTSCPITEIGTYFMTDPLVCPPIVAQLTAS